MDLLILSEIPPWDWPENAGKTIIEVLLDKNAGTADRILAAELAGDGTVMNDNIAVHLLDIVRDSDEPEDLRCKAAISLGPALDYAETMEFDDYDDIMLSEKGFHEVRERLREIYEDAGTPKMVKRRILAAAVRAPMDWHKKAIQTAYSANDHEWLLTSVFSMGYIKGFENRILESLKNENPDVYYEAVCAAGQWGIKAAWPYIKEIFTGGDKNRPLLFAAIEAAGNIAAPEAVDILVELSHSNDEEIEEAANDALIMTELANDDMSDDDMSGDDFSRDDLF
ncbi:MAG: HEAT repeat domain-containing protein [Candidatus Aminicenantes bacterium]|nr:HEAT repeat domain-containing protein [Candidatus Aminicenantes bacterium]